MEEDEEESYDIADYYGGVGRKVCSHVPGGNTGHVGVCGAG